MIHYHLKDWYILTKEIEAITPELKGKLSSSGATFLDEQVFIHAHFFIPELLYPKAEKSFNKAGFQVSTDHPIPCSIENSEYEVFEKRVPIIEGREATLMAELAQEGVFMSGGAGKPHIHISIPSDKRDEILELLSSNAYVKKNKPK